MPGGSTWAPTDTTEWIRSIDKRVTNVERRSRGSDLGVSGAVAIGELDPAYRGPGPAKVILNGTLVGPFDWLTSYQPWGSRTVTMLLVSGTWMISDQASVSGRGGAQRLAMASNWSTYNATQAETGWADWPTITQLSSGLVVLNGFIRITGGATPANDSVVLSGIPAAMRPAEQVIHYINNGDTAKAITIRPDGTITARSGWVAGTYVSLSGISWWPPGTIDWTPIAGTGSGSTWGANFGPDAAWSTQYGVPSFGMDEYGFAWFKGLVKTLVATSTGDTPMVNLPAAYRVPAAEGATHMRTTAADGYAAIGCNSTSGLVWKTGNPGTVNGWHSLAGICVETTAAFTNNPWSPFEGYAGGWTRYSASFPVPGALRRGDGLNLMKGLVGAGALSTSGAFALPQECWPTGGRLLMDTLANSARARLDISGVRESEAARGQGRVCLVNGSNVWFSLDSVKWINQN
jgi:hypothetical protein